MKPSHPSQCEQCPFVQSIGFGSESLYGSGTCFRDTFILAAFSSCLASLPPGRIKGRLVLEASASWGSRESRQVRCRAAGVGRGAGESSSCMPGGTWARSVQGGQRDQNSQGEGRQQRVEAGVYKVGLPGTESQVGGPAPIGMPRPGCLAWSAVQVMRAVDGSEMKW